MKTATRVVKSKSKSPKAKAKAKSKDEAPVFTGIVALTGAIIGFGLSLALS